MFKQPQTESPASARLRIVSVGGTRPEAIKLAPILLEAANRPGIDHALLTTGQQNGLFDDALKTFGLRADHRIDAQWRTAGRKDIKRAIASALEHASLDVVLVQGDTDSALLAAEAAYSVGLPIGHLEAGLRSFDLSNPFPEEQNRVAIAKLATLHFAPSERAADNLRREHVSGHVYVTGNTGIDSLLMRMVPSGPQVANGAILATCHRRENFGVPLERICFALGSLADRGLRFLVPLHSNPNSADVMRALLGDRRGIDLVAPLTFPDLIRAIKSAPFVLSDSGGLQEECAALGIPLLLLRENTERPEVVESGNCALVGSDPGKIVERALTLTRDAKARQAMAQPSFPYGQGQAAAHILNAIETWHVYQTGFKSVQIGPASFCAEARPDV